MYICFTHAIRFILKLVNDNTRCYEVVYITLPLIVLRLQEVIFVSDNIRIQVTFVCIEEQCPHILNR